MIHIYARVSGPEQARDNAVSIPEQLRKCRAIAQMRNVDRFDASEYVDPGVSGAIPLSQRPLGSQMWAALGKGDTVVAAKLDRLFRSSQDALNTMARLHERGVDVILLDMSPEPIAKSAIAQLFLTMLAAFADFERSSINERTRMGRIGKRQKGGCVGSVPYGYKKVGSGKQSMLVPDDKEQEIVACVLRWYRDKSMARIAHELYMRGYRNREGNAIGKGQIKRIWDYEAKRKSWEKAA